MPPDPRLRQVALVARDGERVSAELQLAFGWTEPYHDPGIGTFGLANAVFAVGDTFVEVVWPVEEGTTAGRYLHRRGGDSGYMAIFQVPDLRVARRRVADLGVRVVWRSDHPDIAGTHLHPADVPGAIVSIDWADPPASWRWAGPAWTGAAPDHAAGGIVGCTVEAVDHVAAAARWATVLGLDIPAHDATHAVEAVTLRLPAAGQWLQFVPARAQSDGITEVAVAGLAGSGAVVCGVHFTPASVPPEGGAAESTVPPEGGAAESTVPPEGGAAESTVPPEGGAAESTVPPEGGAAESTVPPEGGAAESTVPPEGGAAESTVPPEGGAAESTVPPAPQRGAP